MEMYMYVQVCTWRLGGWEDIRTFTTLYRMTGKKYLLENWRTGYCVSLITSARSRIAWYLHL